MVFPSKATTRMRNFLYRFPRIKAELPMDLILGDSVILGHCLDMSESGLLGTFADPVPVGSEGLLTLYRGDQSVQVHAKVSSFQGEQARVRFTYNASPERDAMRSFLKLLLPASPSQ